jgi:putative ABC transport system permease protein
LKWTYAVIFENLRVAFDSIRSHLLRAALTMLIIAVGITALVGILTAIDSIEKSVTENFTRLGANSFSIRNREMRVFIGGRGGQSQVFRRITYQEAEEFKNRYEFPAAVSVSVWGTGNATLRFQSKETNPNISITGSDENYLITSGFELASGRNFSPIELQAGRNVIIIGSHIARDLFQGSVQPLGEFITVGKDRYQIIGVLKEKGAALGFSDDYRCIIPISAARNNFSRPSMNYTISVSTNNIQDLEPGIGEATSLFRVIRGLHIQDPNNFDIAKSDNVATALIDSLSLVRWVATIIGLITLLGAAIGLMNIMMVSVTERTQEIGIRKALGANRRTILIQFLAEAIVICQLGGAMGIVFGILAGNLVSTFVSTSFIIPWRWILLGVGACFAVGLVAGIYPAAKASRLDPIEALRYE